jgi:hypothetical protein
MIKTLFFAAALLVPGLADAGTPSADLSGQIVPAGSGISCDQGPNVGAIPAAAQAAGFTHCALNADFTSNTTDANGINFSNTSTFIDQCGANTSIYHFSLGLGFGPNGGPGDTVAPCNYATIVNDSAGGASQALKLIYNSSDQANFLTCCANSSHPFNGPRVTQLSWPTNFNNSIGSNIPPFYYVEITFRIPQSSVTVSGGHTIPVEFWNNAWQNEQDAIANFQFEANSGCTSPCNNWGYAAGLGTFLNQNQYYRSPQGYVIGPDLPNPVYVDGSDWDHYHTISFLLTSDTTAIAQCTYKDESRRNCVEAGLDPASTAATNQRNNNFTTWLGDAACYTSGAAAGCLTGFPVTMYITSIRLWSCATYKTTNCTGTLITSENDDHRRFAALRNIMHWASEKMAPSAHADPFEGHWSPRWYCPDGKLEGSYWSGCWPKELGSGAWWKVCMPGRDDCVWSPTAYLGDDTSLPPRAIRGPGYCYTKQPYTCSPDGKVP